VRSKTIGRMKENSLANYTPWGERRGCSGAVRFNNKQFQYNRGIKRVGNGGTKHGKELGRGAAGEILGSIFAPGASKGGGTAKLQ